MRLTKRPPITTASVPADLATRDRPAALRRRRWDLPGREAGRFDPSASFLREVRKAGFEESELTQVITQGTRSRRWDGCVLLQDRFLGIELELDPSGTIGISARRIS